MPTNDPRAPLIAPTGLDAPAASRFIPVALHDLVDALALEDHPDARRRERFLVLATLFANLVHYGCARHEEEVKQLYAPFNPDRDTVIAREWSAEERRDGEERLLARIRDLFRLANYEEIERDAFLSAVVEGAPRHLEIDPQVDRLDRIILFRRGEGRRRVSERKISRLFRLEESEVATFQRIAVVVKMRGSQQVHLKLFKDVAQSDLDMVIPTAQVRMRLIDRFKLGGSGGTAVIGFFNTAWKLLVAMPFKAFLWPLALVILGIVYGGKTFLDYRKIRDSYLTTMARNLYFLNVANNMSVVSRLADKIGEEETKEVLLAYHVLHRAPRPLRRAELRIEVERYLAARFSVAVAFDVDDALTRLEARGLLVRGPTGGYGEGADAFARSVAAGGDPATGDAGEERGAAETGYAVAPIEEAIQRLDAIWDGIYPASGGEERGRFVWVGTGRRVAPPAEVRAPTATSGEDSFLRIPGEARSASAREGAGSSAASAPTGDAPPRPRSG